MISVVGVYTNPEAAHEATERLHTIGVPEARRVMLIPGTPGMESKLTRLPVAETEQPGMGKVIGGFLGSAVGASAGAGAVAALVPGIGPIMVIGILGVGGALAGAKAGQSIEEFFDEGLPIDELYVYEDALRKGRSVVIAFTTDSTQAELARESLRQSGAETIDVAREDWWLGLRSAEELEYTRGGGDWIQDEVTFRAGFEGALLRGARGCSYEKAIELLRRRYPELHGQEAFERGYTRGRAYLASFERQRK